MLCQFLLHSKVKQLYVCICPCLFVCLFFNFLPIQVTAEHSVELSRGPSSMGFSGGTVIRICPPMQELKRLGFVPWIGKIPWSRKWQPTPVLLSGKLHGQRSVVGYSLGGRKESDLTQRANNNKTTNSYRIWRLTISQISSCHTPLLFRTVLSHQSIPGRQHQFLRQSLHAWCSSGQNTFPLLLPISLICTIPSQLEYHFLRLSRTIKSKFCSPQLFSS